MICRWIPKTSRFKFMYCVQILKTTTTQVRALIQMLLALGLHWCVSVCWCVLGPGISGTFLIYLHSASKTHSRIGVCFIQSIKQQTIQVYNYLSFETSSQGQEKRTTDCRVSEKLHENNYLQGIRPVNYCERPGSRRLSLTPLDPLIFPHDMSSFPDLYLHAPIIIF